MKYRRNIMVRIDDELYELIQNAAEKDDRTVASIVRLILQNSSYLKRFRR